MADAATGDRNISLSGGTSNLFTRFAAGLLVDVFGPGEP